LRMKVELADWVDAYAERRGSSRTAVIEAALRSFRGDAAGGVPGLEEPSGVRAGDSAPGASGGRSPRPAVPRGPVRVRPLVSTAAELMLERQKRLNRGRPGQ
jgi:hypothetical protein